MEKLFFKSSLILLAALFIVSCAKEEKAPDETSPITTPANTSSFTWTLSTGQAVTADSAHCYASITTVYAFKNGNTNSIEVNLSAISAGSYSISSATGNSFSFVSGPTSYDATSGSFNITANSGNKLSGNFVVAFAGGPVTTMSGNFQDIAKR